MGFTPRQVDDMSPWEFGATWTAYLKANSPPAGPTAPTAEEFAAAVAPTIH